MPPQILLIGRLCSLIDLNWPTCNGFLSSGHCGFRLSELRMHSVQNKWPQGVSDDWSATTPRQIEHMRSWGTSSGFKRRSRSMPWLRPLPWNAGGGGLGWSMVMVWVRAGRAAIVAGLPRGLYIPPLAAAPHRKCPAL